MKQNHKLSWLSGTVLMFLCSCCMEQPIETRIKTHPTTFCNPLNLDYRFMKIDGGEGIREAADPVFRILVFFRFQFVETCHYS